MLRFIQRHAEKIIGLLNGWDRIRLRGTLRWLANVDGMESYLYQAKVLLKDFKDYVSATTEEACTTTSITSTRSWASCTRGCKPGFPSRCTSA